LDDWKIFIILSTAVPYGCQLTCCRNWFGAGCCCKGLSLHYCYAWKNE